MCPGSEIYVKKNCISLQKSVKVVSKKRPVNGGEKGNIL